VNSGIYRIKNIVNEKCYVGSAINIRRRWTAHRKILKDRIHHNVLLQRAWDKYGNGLFEFSVIEYVEDLDKLISREQYYIDTLRPEYNICLVAGNVLGIRFKHSDETKQKLRQNALGRLHTEETKEKLKGPLSEKHKKNISKSRKGMKFSEETKHKMRKPRSKENKDKIREGIKKWWSKRKDDNF
jgi:group I intron endonuclease